MGKLFCPRSLERVSAIVVIIKVLSLPVNTYTTLFGGNGVCNSPLDRIIAMRFVALIMICLLMTSCGFSHLTKVQNQDSYAPTAKECGSCHVEQYAEWLQTAHARSFTSPEFKLQSDQYEEEECLFCHVPGGVQNPERMARSYNREEGVTCLSCHLYKQAMHGPHESGALLSPHAIVQDSKVDSKKDSSQLCGVCHEETYEQWAEKRVIKQYPTCHGCHGTVVERPHTKGTNFFSNILVTFEPVHKVRSHYLNIPKLTGQGIGPEIEIQSIDDAGIHFSLINSLPHDLPAGSYGEKELFIVVSWSQADGKVVDKKKIIISSVLAPDQKTSFDTAFNKGAHSQTLSVELFRFHHSTKKITLIRSYLFAMTPP